MSPTMSPLIIKDGSVRSPSLPLFEPSLAHFAASLGDAGVASASAASKAHNDAAISFARVLWSAAEKIVLPRIEKPGEKGGDGIYVEKTLFDSFKPANITLSAVRVCF
jgi:hypothetical protein